MSRNFAICIGINEYDNLRDLRFAVRDAEAVRQFCLEEARFEQVYLFSDRAEPIPAGNSSFKATPTFGRLDNFLTQRFQKPFLSREDNVWFFFAGHGRLANGRDYLLPSDCNPSDVPKTGLAVQDVAALLRRSGAGNVVLFLDACRSEDAERRNGLGIGQGIQGVVTLFSCDRGQVSYELEELSGGQGVFTAALLQGLRINGEGNCATVARLERFLQGRVPELCRRYGRPVQTPYAVPEPSSKAHLLLLPLKAYASDLDRLKICAQAAELEGNWDLAEELWLQVLAAPGVDPDARRALLRLEQRRTQAPQPPQPGSQPSNPAASGGRSATLPSLPMSRRQLLQVGLWTAGSAGVVLAGSLLREALVSDPGPTPTPEPTMTLTLAPTDPPSPTPEPTPTPLQRMGLPVNEFRFTTATVDIGGTVTKLPDSGPAYEYRVDLPGGVPLRMVYLAGGTFRMGSPETEKDRDSDESLHDVTVPEFFLGRHLVTQAQWFAVTGQHWSASKVQEYRERVDGYGSNFVGDVLPMVGVSWNDVQAFCELLNQYFGVSGFEWRLPTEAEWEYGCRAGTQTPFAFGETITPELANYDWLSQYLGNEPTEDFRGYPTPVGQFPVNRWGLSDMHGNVWEWCADEYHESYAYNTGVLNDDRSGRYVLRGGSWNYAPRNCRSATRVHYDPGYRDYRNGFRLACSARGLP
ncbi:MAG: SUMF1/EgtB/PvdO family nonheme iron enzyme [Prochlorothrix sp.]